MKQLVLNISLLSVFSIIFNNTFSQKVGNILDSLTVLKYAANFSDTFGNSTVEETTIKSLGIPWEPQKTQTKVELYYSPTDSVINQLYNPISKKGKEKDIRITTKTTTGIMDDTIRFWIHPFRANQYVYTEIAPFPEVYHEHLKIGGKWEGKMFILSGWGSFKGKMKTYYEVTSLESFNYKNATIENCWRIKAIAIHNKLGTSTLSCLFHPEYGFLSMEYFIYNGVKMNFTLVDKQ